jgi:hypothetical protein
MIVVKKDASNNPVTEYYVGTSVGLYSTVGLGDSLLASNPVVWQREGASVLNYAVVRSLAYRPTDNVMVIGTHGNGMYYANLGTPNFTPNITGFDPVTNDRNFISAVYPTVTPGELHYRTGGMLGIKKISLQLFTVSGQEVLSRQSNYQPGSVDISMLPKGAYILNILSDNRKYRHVQKILKQ